MKVIMPPKAPRTPPVSRFKVNAMKLLFVGLLALGAWAAYNLYGLLRPLSMDEKIEALGLEKVPRWIAERHVSISEHAFVTSPVFATHTNLTPVHIMYRENDKDAWTLRGTGAISSHWPGFVFSAHHVFEDDIGQYGFEFIGPDEFRHLEKIVPITSIEDTVADDQIMCRYDTNRTDFPLIKASHSNVIFKDFKKNVEYRTLVYDKPMHGRLLTRPNEIFEIVFGVEVRTNTWLLFSTSDMAPGESGSIGMVEEEQNTNALIIVTARMPISEHLFSEDVKKKIKWTPERQYGVIEMFKID